MVYTALGCALSCVYLITPHPHCITCTYKTPVVSIENVKTKTDIGQKTSLSGQRTRHPECVIQIHSFGDELVALPNAEDDVGHVNTAQDGQGLSK